MWTLMESPVGTLRVVADGEVIRMVEFVSGPPGPPVTSATPPVSVAHRGHVGDRDDAVPVLGEAVRQLRAYFDRDLKEFDLPLDPAGTPFQRRVWEELRRVGYGQTRSYGEVARRLGLTPAASRAVGAANGRNPIPIVIPCHRVVGADGSLTGYAGGIERKQLLLDLETEPLF